MSKQRVIVITDNEGEIVQVALIPAGRTGKTAFKLCCIEEAESMNSQVKDPEDRVTWDAIAGEMDYEVLPLTTLSAPMTRAKALKALSDKFGDDKRIKEYIDEAEHQEGYGYWKTYFKTVEEVLADAELYLKNMD